jgi:c-di-AMP phosphodiesterase-like protein
MRNIIQPFPFQFVPNNGQVLEENQRIGDPDIKKETESVEWRNEYILMLLENWQKIKSNKYLTIPSIIKERTEQNIGDNVPIKEWVDNNLEEDKGDTLLSDIYKQYVLDTPLNPVKIQHFSSYLQLLKYKTKRVTKGQEVIGVKLKVLLNLDIK